MYWHDENTTFSSLPSPSFGTLFLHLLPSPLTPPITFNRIAPGDSSSLPDFLARLRRASASIYGYRYCSSSLAIAGRQRPELRCQFLIPSPFFTSTCYYASGAPPRLDIYSRSQIVPRDKHKDFWPSSCPETDLPSSDKAVRLPQHDTA